MYFILHIGVVAVTGENDRSLMEDVDGDREPQPQKQEGRGLSTEHGGSVSGCPLQSKYTQTHNPQIIWSACLDMLTTSSYRG